MKRIAVIVVPHPDDLDILVNHAVQYLVKHSYNVYEIMMTGGEYGVVNRSDLNSSNIKGLKLRAIRKMENSASKKAYDVLTDNPPAVKTIYLNYVDGYVPFNRKSVRVLAKIIKDLSPSVIIGPDPVFAIDWHHDHIKTGWNVYFAVKLLKESGLLPQKVKFLMFQTYKPNYFFPLGSWDVYKNSLKPHRSQLTPFGIKMMVAFQRLLYIIFKRKRFGLREIRSFDKKNSYKGIVDLIVLSLFRGNTFIAPSSSSIYSPPPEQLGLKVDPFDEDDML